MKFRIPLAGSYNTRTSITNALSSASGFVGLGIVGIMIVGATVQSTDKDQRFINTFASSVVNPYTGKKTIYTTKRPGFAALSTPRTGHIGTAIMVWTGQGAGTKIISAFGNTNSNIYDSTSSLGAITGKATKITETFVSTTPTLVISSTDNTGWYYDAGSGLTKISDGQFPGNNGLTLAGSFAHMDGYAFIMDTAGAIWNSDVNSVTSWTATGTISANSYPDLGRGVVRHGDKLMAFGSESIQFYYNAGNPSGSPLSRIESMTLRVGCVSADAIASLEDVTYWVGSSPQGGLMVFSYGNGGLRKVSTPEIEQILILAGAANISMTSLELLGRNFVIVNAANVTFVYCAEENAWHEWNSQTARIAYKCAGVSSGSSQVFYSVSNLATTGKIYTVNPSSLVYQDDGAAFTATMQLSKMGEATVRTFWNELRLLGDTQASSSPVTVSYSDDDYQNWVTLGTIDMSASPPSRKINRCGAAYERAWKFTHSANTPLRLEAMAGARTAGMS